jgi:hypothetical protein
MSSTSQQEPETTVIQLCCSNSNKPIINRHTPLYIYIVLLYQVFSYMFRLALKQANICCTHLCLQPVY